MQSESSKPLYRGAQIVWYSLSVIEVFLLGRFVLKLLQANPEALFTNVVYTLSGIFTYPFEAVFQNDRVAGSVFEWTTLLALVVYWLVAFGIIKLFFMSKSVSVGEADARLSQERL